MSLVVVIYYHFKKLSVDQDPRLCNLPNKSYSKIDVRYTSGDDLIKESSQSVNGLPIKVINIKQKLFLLSTFSFRPCVSEFC